jgi:hypothetical protein
MKLKASLGRAYLGFDVFFFAKAAGQYRYDLQLN